MDKVSLRQAVEAVEAALGENLVWLSDKLDQDIRQKNADTMARLARIEGAWKLACIALAQDKE